MRVVIGEHLVFLDTRNAFATDSQDRRPRRFEQYLRGGGLCNAVTLLVHAVRWPRRPAWVVIFALWTYGIATESLQAFVPRRTVELKDYIENITGVLAGSGVYWLIPRWIEQRRAEPERHFEADARAVSTETNAE